MNRLGTNMPNAGCAKTRRMAATALLGRLGISSPVERQAAIPMRLALAAVVLAAVAWNSALAQKPAPQASAQDYGLVISREGPVRQGEGRRVLVHGAAGGEVVALVHVDV